MNRIFADQARLFHTRRVWRRRPAVEQRLFSCGGHVIEAPQEAGQARRVLTEGDLGYKKPAKAFGPVHGCLYYMYACLPRSVHKTLFFGICVM